jgi:hypothetical protein
MRTAQHVLFVLVTATMLGPMLLTNSIQAQEDERCFPETGQCISRRFREFWEQNGGLAVFGYPLTPAEERVNADDGQTYLTQVFERQRFELHPANAAPYDVQLGRLGNDILLNRGDDLQQQERADPIDGCRYFEATGHNLCDGEADTTFPGGPALRSGFRSYWERNGLPDPALNPYGRSLALFGMPLTEPTIETNSSGETVLAQQFERARFEIPVSLGSDSLSRRGDLVLGRLGAELHVAALDPEAIAQDVGQIISVDEQTIMWTGTDQGSLVIYTSGGDGQDPQALPIAVDQNAIGGLLFDDTHIYWKTREGVRRSPRAGGDPETLVTPPRGVTLLALDENDIYWSDVSGFINRAPKSGGAPVEVAQSGGQVVDLAFDEQYVYWYLYDGTVHRMPKAGGEPQRLLEIGSNYGSGQIFVDDANIYVLAGGAPGESGRLSKASKDGSGLSTLDDNTRPQSLTFDENTIYWSTDSGFVKSTPKAGGPVTILATAQHLPRDLFVSSRGVYWRNQNGALMYARFDQ